jgi:hypothetical protein
MDHQTYLSELKKLNPKHKNLEYFSNNRGAVVLNMLRSAVERERRIKGQSASDSTPKASVGVNTDADTASDTDADADADTESIDVFKKRIIKKNPTFNFEDLSPEMQKKYDQIGELYKERTALHERAKLAEISQEDRAIAINEAHEISNSIAALYLSIDNYIASQSTVDPSIDTSNVVGVAEKLSELQRVRTAVSRLKAKIDKATESEKPALLDKLTRFMADKEILEAWQKSLK